MKGEEREGERERERENKKGGKSMQRELSSHTLTYSRRNSYFHNHTHSHARIYIYTKTHLIDKISNECHYAKSQARSTVWVFGVGVGGCVILAVLVLEIKRRPLNNQINLTRGWRKQGWEEAFVSVK